MLTKDQYNQLLFNRQCDLIVIEHLDIYQVLHWTPDQFFARKSGNVIYHSPKPGEEEVTFIILLEDGIRPMMLHTCDVAGGERIVVSFRKAIQDRIGYAFVSLQKRKIPLDFPKGADYFKVFNYD